MKRCPRCNQTYNDDQLNFCLNDGEMLTTSPQPTRYADDSPPTLFMNEPRITNPYDRPKAPAPMQWQPPQPQNMQPRQFMPFQLKRSADQTMPTIALVLGILSLPMICCYGGIWLGLPAAVLGFIGMRNADSDSERYGGRGMAIAGLVLGSIGFLATLGWIIFVVLASAA